MLTTFDRNLRFTNQNCNLEGRMGGGGEGSKGKPVKREKFMFCQDILSIIVAVVKVEQNWTLLESQLAKFDSVKSF